MKRTLLLALVAAAAPRLAAQDPRLDERADPHLRAAIAAQLDSARQASLPTAPLVDKVLEGITKQADSARIVGAVRKLRSELGQARQALGARTSEQELVVGAEALRAGITPDALQRVRDARPTGSLVVPLSVLADLVSRGVPADTAASAVLAFARQKASDDDLERLRRNVEHDILAGVTPAVSAAVRANLPGAAPAPVRPPGASP